MQISYDKLWMLLIDRKMEPADLRRDIHMAPNTLTRLYHGKEVSLEILYRICMVLGVGIGDIMEFLPGETKEEPHG